MKRAVLLLAVLALALAACTNSFTPAAMSAETTAAQAASKAAGALVTSVDATTMTSLTYGRAAQKLTIIFTGGNLTSTADIANLGTALAVYRLGAAAASDGSYSRGASLSLGTPSVSIAAGNTVAIYTLDLSVVDATMSDRIEVVIAGDKLTGNNGVKVLDLDGDKVAGEAGEDDYVAYPTVAGAPVNALGNARSPRYTLGGGAFAPTFTLGNAVVTFSALTTANTAAADIDLSTLSTAISLQKWNAGSSAWAAVSGTAAYNAGTGVYTITLPSAVALGEVYRVVYTSPYNIAEKAAVRGYIHRFRYNNKLSSEVGDSDGGTVGTQLYFATGAPATESTASYSATAYFDAYGYNGYVLIVFSGLGNMGIDPATLTNDNIKIFDDTLNTYVSVASLSLIKNGSSAQVAAALPPSYKSYYSVGSLHNFIVCIGPGAKDLGNTTATTDDQNLGYYDQVTNVPYGFSLITGTSFSSGIQYL